MIAKSMLCNHELVHLLEYHAIVLLFDFTHCLLDFFFFFDYYKSEETKVRAGMGDPATASVFWDDCLVGFVHWSVHVSAVGHILTGSS